MLDEPVGPPPPLARGALQFATARWVVLMASGDAGPRERGSVIDVDELLEFAQHVKTSMPGARVLLHQYGLRASLYEGDIANGPAVDWSRDWD